MSFELEQLEQYKEQLQIAYVRLWPLYLEVVFAESQARKVERGFWNVWLVSQRRIADLQAATARAEAVLAAAIDRYESQHDGFLIRYAPFLRHAPETLQLLVTPLSPKSYIEVMRSIQDSLSQSLRTARCELALCRAQMLGPPKLAMDRRAV